MSKGTRFRPARWSVALTAFGVALFACLGIWQLQRAAFKDAVQARFENRLALDYQPLRAVDDLADIQYRKLRLEGRFDPEHHFLLDNQIYRGAAGYQVITPLHLADSDRILLVNRGWAPWGESRQSPPALLPPVQTGTVLGTAFVPSAPALAFGEVEVGDSWPQLLPYVDLDALREQYSPRLLPMILWMAPEQPGAYVREWDPVWMPPEKSRAYALQWFVFAGAAVLLFVILNLRKTE